MIMKKIFTLIATAMVAMSGYAQTESYAVAEGFVPEDGQTVEATASVTLMYGADGAWKNSSPGEADPKFTDFPFYVVGDNNPKTSENKGFTPGNAATLPQKGTYYTFTAKQSGTLEVAIKLNASKSLYIADAADGMNYSASAVLTNTEGATVELSSSFQVSSSFTGFAKIGILKDQSLLVFCAGSKLSFFGFKFTPGEITEDPGTPHAAKAWDFMSKLSETDKANITADATNWDIVTVTDAETGEVKGTNYKYKNKLEGVAVMANGAELELTAGLKFRTGAGKFEYYDGERLAHGGNGHGPIIPECGKDDVVKFRFKTTEASRGFEVGNLELTAGSLISDDKGVYEATMSVKKKGDVTFASVTGADILALAINAELPEMQETAIATVVNTAELNGAMYNLAGQQVTKAYKGVVIQNGKKFINK